VRQCIAYFVCDFHNKYVIDNAAAAVADDGDGRLLYSLTPKVDGPTQSSKTQLAETQQQATAPTAADKDDKKDDSITSPAAASRTKEPTPPRPRYILVSASSSSSSSSFSSSC